MPKTRPRMYSTEQLIEAIVDCRGRVTHAAQRVGCKPDVFYQRAEIEPELREAWDKARERSTDDAEHVVQQSFENEDRKLALDAAKWWLSRMGRSRGFGDKQEVEISGNADIVFDFRVVHPDGTVEHVGDLRGEK